jgi:5-methylcytosine-specific restriction endonuclease McrA
MNIGAMTWYNGITTSYKLPVAELPFPQALRLVGVKAMSDSIISTKRCTRCGEEKPATSEYFYTAKKGTFRADCRKCVILRSKQYRDTHIEELQEKRKAFREEHPDIVSDRKHRHYVNHKEEIRETARQYRKDNAEQIREKDRARIRKRNPEVAHQSYLKNKDKRYAYACKYRKANAEKYRQYQNEYHKTEKMRRWKRQWDKSNSDRLIGYQRKWARANPDKVREAAHRRRAKIAKLPHSFTTTEWKRAIEYFGGVCAYCSNPPSLFDINLVLQQEHHIPLNNGGSYTPDNIIPACQSCNTSKHDSDPHEWLVSKFGPRRAKQILKRIETYFAWVKENTPT